MNNTAQLKNYWDKAYESVTTPFDIDAPDEWIMALEVSGKIHGDVLDSGCGPGRTSLYLADLGYFAIGMDISINAIERARRKAAERGSKALFQQANMCELSGYDECFDTVVDIGCFHSLYNDGDRAAYATTLHRVCRAGAVVYLRAFSETNLTKANYPIGEGLPALREEQIRTAFSLKGWVVKDLVEREIELYISEDEKPRTYCWFAEMHMREEFYGTDIVL